MPNPITIALDAMGGDGGPDVTIAALPLFLEDHPSLRIILFGEEKRVLRELNKREFAGVRSKVSFVACGSVVDDAEKPSLALRNKRDSSMARSIEAVSVGTANACVSAGSTGALIAFGIQLLDTLPCITRPAICGSIPSASGTAFALDLGANLECSPEQLHQFACLGSLTCKIINNVNEPTIKLLNVGKEEVKGPQLIQSAAELIKHDVKLNYRGFIEADQIFSNDADVIVCDGLSGNIALKASEGVAKIWRKFHKDQISDNWLSKLGMHISRRSLRQLNHRLNPATYNGAYLLGLKGIAIKSHGGADSRAFYETLNIARLAAEHDLPKALDPMLQNW